ncbi:HlyD family secretion protein [Mesorhizobium sp. LSHC412B00]|uniref:HlyD family secretion protein n=1 Tax=Mesorhizobium sp. LSHC412B00 TaxID=1287285 RepID=UPI0003CF5B15|nr:HlyD family secretion protein [Mesorhizobium sp. LSHC412B00]ESX90843.1 DSBA oxidoreductase [Mesorhizobium sp. LSHC412B00]
MNTSNRFRTAVGLIVVATLAGAYFILNRPEASASEQSTDDAYVQADFTIVVPQVTGLITEVAITDHQRVQAGAPLVNIDERNLRISLNEAQADIAGAEANVDSLKAQIARQQSTIEQARSAVAASEANLRFAEADGNRAISLARAGTGSVRSREEAQAQWDIQRAAFDRDVAGLHSSEQQTGILNADLEKALADLLAAQAAKATAELNLSYARVTAPVSGVVAQLEARVGGYARVGEALLTLVPLDAIYVEANFRETQLSRMQVGQPVLLSVDALPGVRLKGRVESLGPASGVSFSAVAPHNATGNFTKIIQRLPVRIKLDDDQEDVQRLRVGMSVRPTINVSVNSGGAS